MASIGQQKKLAYHSTAGGMVPPIPHLVPVQKAAPAAPKPARAPRPPKPPKPAPVARTHSHAGRNNAGVSTASAVPTAPVAYTTDLAASAATAYAGGQTGGGATGYGSNYSAVESQSAAGPDPAAADASASPAASTGFKLTTKEKIWIGVGLGGAFALWVVYWRITSPLRRYRRVKGLVQTVIAAGKSLANGGK